MPRKIDSDYLREILQYDPCDGRFLWRVRKGRRVKPGQIAGTLDSKGHRQIKIDGQLYLAHRLAWIYMNGELPQMIDHANGRKDDNRICNLRPCNTFENMQNRNSKSGFLGVWFHKGMSRWVSAIKSRGERYHLGYFDHAEDAHLAYLAAKSRLHEFQPIPRATL